MDGKSIYELLDSEKVSASAAVPTVWLGLLQHLADNDLELPYLKRVLIGGAACPRMMIETLENKYDCRGYPWLGHDRNVTDWHHR